MKNENISRKPLKVTGIIDTAMDGCVQVYAPIEADLQDICRNHLNAEYDAFCYDWRQDVFKSMSQLAVQLDVIGSNNSISSITLICHSQGGQIAYLMLESGTDKHVSSSRGSSPPFRISS